jgi:dTDP-4-dehydrorhamnose 3,5-epimerase
VKRIETSLPGVWVLDPVVHGDPRGFFFESYHAERFADLGIAARFVQDNHSRSVCGTLRGLHYQLRRPQAKLCRVVVGAVLDVVVDIRRGSPTFGRHASTVLSAANKRQIFVPAGFAHGFVVQSEEAEFLYKCDDYYVPDDQYGIAWDDPDLGIDWGLVGLPILSPKDERNPRLRDTGPEALPPYRVPER